ncbi:MAG: methionyl-tRNA formyltransferase [Longimicrobiales bacterium]
MRVLFWGTPEFALPSLRALLGEAHDVVAVVTQPDRPAGRGRKLRAPPVKQLALEEKLMVLQPEQPYGAEFLETMRALDAEISVVVAYGQILKREVLDVPGFGTINVHASLLPGLRGAAPINWAIERGHDETGVTIMRIAERLDAGPILHQVREPITDEETASDLATRLSELGAEALIEALALMEMDSIEEEEQEHDRATYAPKLTREDAHIDWIRSAVELGRHIRALDSKPGAWSRWHDEDIKLYRPTPMPDNAHDATPGTVLEHSDADGGLLIACGSGAILVREVKLAGKRRMTVAEWARGRGAVVGDLFH